MYKRQLLVDGEPVRLTATEYKIMELLMEHPGYVFSAEEIYSQGMASIISSMDSFSAIAVISSQLPLTGTP